MAGARANRLSGPAPRSPGNLDPNVATEASAVMSTHVPRPIAYSHSIYWLDHGKDAQGGLSIAQSPKPVRKSEMAVAGTRLFSIERVKVQCFMTGVEVHDTRTYLQALQDVDAVRPQGVRDTGQCLGSGVSAKRCRAA